MKKNGARKRSTEIYEDKETRRGMRATAAHLLEERPRTFCAPQSSARFQPRLLSADRVLLDGWPLPIFLK